MSEEKDTSLKQVAEQLLRYLGLVEHSNCSPCKCFAGSVNFMEEALRTVERETLERAAKVAEITTISLAQSFSPNEVGRIVADDIRALAKNGDTLTCDECKGTDPHPPHGEYTGSEKKRGTET